MKKILFYVVVLIIINSSAYTQRFHLGIFGGLAAYNGDLADKVFPKKVTNGAIGITANYELTDKFMLRAGYTYAIVGGADRFSNNHWHLERNLSFETKINEFSLVGEYYLQNLYDHKFSPYAFAGLAVFHYNPYAYSADLSKVYLKPLSTEGQGLAAYPGRKEYKLTQLAIPFGAGVKFAATDKLHIGLELGMRKTFTDYLDDVSTAYVDPADLLAAKGQLAVDMSYRGDEVGFPAYPVKDYQRGGADLKDFYYFTGIHLTYRIGNGLGNGGGGGRKSRFGCPTNIF
jgi:opacity protein-like surface antigen